MVSEAIVVVILLLGREWPVRKLWAAVTGAAVTGAALASFELADRRHQAPLPDASGNVRGDGAAQGGGRRT